MKTGEEIFCRVFIADILLAVTWLLLGGSMLEAVIITVLQAGLLLAIEAVIRTGHQLVEEFRERRQTHYDT